MRTNSHLARIESMAAPLCGEFGRDYACKTFGLTPAQLEAIVGRYTKGKRKGELRGEIRWRKVVRGGWVRTGAGYDGERGMGHVVKPGLRFDHAIVNPWKPDRRGEPTVLWSEDFQRFGWVPGETREQYDARQKARQEAMRGLQRLASERAAAVVSRLTVHQLSQHWLRRKSRSERNYALSFVLPLLDAELMRRVEEANKLGVNVADLPIATPNAKGAGH